MRRHVLHPVNMSQSGFLPAPERWSDCAPAWYHVGQSSLWKRVLTTGFDNTASSKNSIASVLQARDRSRLFYNRPVLFGSLQTHVDSDVFALRVGMTPPETVPGRRTGTR